MKMVLVPKTNEQCVATTNVETICCQFHCFSPFSPLTCSVPFLFWTMGGKIDEKVQKRRTLPAGHLWGGRSSLTKSIFSYCEMYLLKSSNVFVQIAQNIFVQKYNWDEDCRLVGKTGRLWGGSSLSLGDTTSRHTFSHIVSQLLSHLLKSCHRFCHILSHFPTFCHIFPHCVTAFVTFSQILSQLCRNIHHIGHKTCATFIKSLTPRKCNSSL